MGWRLCLSDRPRPCVQCPGRCLGLCRDARHLLKRVIPSVGLGGSVVTVPPRDSPVLCLYHSCDRWDPPGPERPSTGPESWQNRHCFTLSTICTQWGLYQLLFLKVKSGCPQRTHFLVHLSWEMEKKRTLAAFLTSEGAQFKCQGRFPARPTMMAGE